MQYKLLDKFIVKSRAINKAIVKQYFEAIVGEDESSGLIITKLALSKDIEIWGTNSIVVKKFKDFYLFKQEFSIKLSTLDIITKRLKSKLKLLKYEKLLSTKVIKDVTK
jgi:hypothetical protein